MSNEIPPVIGNVMALEGPFMAKGVSISVVAVTTIYSLIAKTEADIMLIIGFSIISMLILGDIIREEVENK